VCVSFMEGWQLFIVHDSFLSIKVL